MRTVEEQRVVEHDLESYLNTAVEAATLGKVADCNYFLRQAAVSARALGWEQNYERLVAVARECANAAGGRR